MSSEDVVVVSSPGDGDGISSLPGTYLEALSAIQEQSFVEAGLEDPDHYAEAFTLKHRVSFFKTGLFAGIGDSLLTVFGMVLYTLGKMQAIEVFGNKPAGTVDLVLAFLVAAFPYIATVLLTVKVFSKISGTISKSMALFLVLGFSVGAILCTALAFIVGYGTSTEYAASIYRNAAAWETVFPFLGGLADFFWYGVRHALVKGTWDELGAAVLVSLCLLLAYMARSYWLGREKRKGA